MRHIAVLLAAAALAAAIAGTATAGYAKGDPRKCGNPAGAHYCAQESAKISLRYYMSAKEGFPGTARWDADITWNQNTHYDKRENLGYLLVNVIMLTVIIMGLAIVAGLVFFGFRITLKKYFPQRVFGTEDGDIIRLDIGK